MAPSKKKAPPDERRSHADRVDVFDDLEALSQAAAERITAWAEEAMAERGRFSLVLSGGSTPRRLYELLAGPFSSEVPWGQTHLFWSDERFVPPAHEASNFRMARETLIDHVPLPEENVHRVPTEASSHEQAAEAYDETLRGFFRAGEASVFDVALLGLGADGHTASLFPETFRPTEPSGRVAQWAEAVTGPPRRPPVERITLTLAALCATRRAVFLVAGSEKREALRAILDETPEAEGYPAACVRPAEERLWLVDAAAYGASAA